jgi:hypothetical protein
MPRLDDVGPFLLAFCLNLRRRRKCSVPVGMVEKTKGFAEKAPVTPDSAA